MFVNEYFIIDIYNGGVILYIKRRESKRDKERKRDRTIVMLACYRNRERELYIYHTGRTLYPISKPRCM